MSVDVTQCTDKQLLDALDGSDTTLETLECEERLCRNCDNHCDFYLWDDIRAELEDRGYIDIGCDKYVKQGDYDPSPCCSGVATSGGDPESCNCDLKRAENE